jgi:nucleotide-binding universal stress UspA family protein
MNASRKEGFKRVLVAIDGSEVSMRAAEHAARIAKHEGADLFALLVVLAPAFRVPGEPADYYDEARKEARMWMQDAEAIAEKHGKGLKSEIIVGALTPLDGILGYAETISADLIVTGRRGKASSARRLIGSVSSGLVEYANCAVLVVK